MDYTGSGGLAFGGDAIETSSYYSYLGAGSITAKRCGHIIGFFPKRIIAIQFTEGDRAWLRYEAERGRIRSVWVKKVKIVVNRATLARPTVVYFDNLNAVFNEEDLITHSMSLNLAIAYHQRRLIEAQKAIECL